MGVLKITRRDFVSDVVVKSTGILIGNKLLPLAELAQSQVSKSEPLFDRALWERYRHTVRHPSLVIKNRHRNIALNNIRLHEWARNYVANLENSARHHLIYTEDKQLQALIQETTPGDPLWTPCPACRDQGKPMHPHGLWKWDVANHQKLECTVCGTVYPNEQYPETVVLKTTWGKPQQLTFFGGETFRLFEFPHCRPTFAGNIRSRCVKWCADYARVLAETHTLTNKPEYADACRKILLRLAYCYPNWLVHVGYGEYADMNPRQAALSINELPEPELTPPPNQPDHKLWTGYWSAGRSRGVGLEADFVIAVTEAYDLTCSATAADGKPVYSESERITIEKDLLLEGTILLVCDKKINNKSVRNRTAAGLVGICTGHPELFRFGLEGFRKTLEEWFHTDGTTSESPIYGFMTLKGIWALAEASKNYSDPAGYQDQKKTRIDGLNLYREKKYSAIFEALFNGMQGDMTYPPYADSFYGLSIEAPYVDLMVANYPENKSYYALLQQLSGNNLSRPSGPAPPGFFEKQTKPLSLQMESLVQHQAFPTDSLTSFSMFFRDPEASSPDPEAILSLPDWCPESLRIGHLRTGIDGRESLLTVSASRWGTHHHQDSLNLYYWKNGHEILSDFGYLWDHPQKQKTVRTLAHNTVLINEKDQLMAQRNGEVTFFETGQHAKVIRAESQAYEEARVYSRTTAVIDHGNGQNYAADFFEVDGGEIQDYVFHLSELFYQTENLPLQPDNRSKLYDLDNIHTTHNESVGSISWPISPYMKAKAWIIPTGDQVSIGNGWGQRNWKNADLDKRVPYVVRRTKGAGPKKFITLFEGYSGSNSFIKNVRFHTESGIVEVITLQGVDFIASSLAPEKFSYAFGPVRIAETCRFFALTHGGPSARYQKLVIP